MRKWQINYPQTINYFFFVCMHQYGFWYGDEKGYVEPLYGKIGGKQIKGSDLLWRVSKKALDKDEEVFEPKRLAVIRPKELAKIFSDDNGPIPFPDFEKRFQLTSSYGRWFAEGYIDRPSLMVEAANLKFRPLRHFINSTYKIPGYNKDNYAKKNTLLAMVLANRPEQFLKVIDEENWQPIIDYHMMRVALRLGLVDLDPEQEKISSTRRWIDGCNENDIRDATYQAVEEIINISKKPMSFIDHKLWMARKYCPEVEKPDCEKCIFTEVCEKRINLFQPVFRTTAY